MWRKRNSDSLPIRNPTQQRSAMAAPEFYTDYRFVYHFYGFTACQSVSNTGITIFDMQIQRDMEQVERIDTVKQYNNWIGADTLHPLVSVINFNEIPSVQHFRRYM